MGIHRLYKFHARGFEMVISYVERDDERIAVTGHGWVEILDRAAARAHYRRMIAAGWTAR